jgi:hypothetical protein
MPAPGKQTPEFPLPTGLDPLRLQQLLWLLVAYAGKQATGFPLPDGLAPPCLQQLLWLLEADAPTQVDTRASTAWWKHQTIQACWLCCPMGTLNLLLRARRPLPHMQVNPRFHTSLFCWCQEASLHIKHGSPALATKPTHGESPHCPVKEQEPSSSTEW